MQEYSPDPEFFNPTFDNVSSDVPRFSDGSDPMAPPDFYQGQDAELSGIDTPVEVHDTQPDNSDIAVNPDTVTLQEWITASSDGSLDAPAGYNF
jgi:hypothetical protein